MKANPEYNGKGIFNPYKSSLWPSTNDFASYGRSPMLISSVVFTWLTKKSSLNMYRNIDENLWRMSVSVVLLYNVRAMNVRYGHSPFFSTLPLNCERSLWPIDKRKHCFNASLLQQSAWYSLPALESPQGRTGSGLIGPTRPTGAWGSCSASSRPRPSR